MNAETLASLYGYTHFTLKRNSEGVSHEESLRAPEPAGNCLNWVLGHIVVHRNIILGLVSEPPVWSKEESEPYDRGSAPFTESSRVRPLADILAALERSQERLLPRLRGMTETDLAAPAEGGTLGNRLAFFYFHEAYHAGQVGLLRRLAGKEGAIR